jgi:hypothetical protein
MKRTMKEIKEQYSKVQWYHQAGAVRPLYVGHACKACLGFTVQGKPVPFSYEPFGIYLKHDFFHVYFPRHILEKVSAYYVQREARAPGFIDKLYHHFEQIHGGALRKAIDRVQVAHLDALSNQELLMLFQEFSMVHQRLWYEGMFLDAFDVTSEGILEHAVQKEGATISGQDLQILTSAIALSWLQKEKSELLKLAKEVKQDQALAHVLLGEHVGWEVLQHQFSQFAEALKTHAANYHWIHNDYAVMRQLDGQFFLQEIQIFLRDEEFYSKETEALI